MGLYRRLYAPVEALGRARAKAGEIHGSVVRDIFIEYANGRFCVDTHPEKLLVELVEEGEAVILQRAPTHSQAAFTGLGYSQQGYNSTPWGPGTVEHYWYRVRV